MAAIRSPVASGDASAAPVFRLKRPSISRAISRAPAKRVLETEEQATVAGALSNQRFQGFRMGGEDCGDRGLGKGGGGEEAQEQSQTEQPK